MSRIIVVGSSNTDMVVRSSKIPQPGETVLGGTFQIYAGGKGANQAVAAARGGGEVTFIGKLGMDDFGHRAMEGLKEEGISTDYIFKDETNASGVALIVVNESNGQNAIVVAPGSNNALSIQDINSSEKVFAKASVLLVQLETPIDVVGRALHIGKKNGLKCILNPAPAQYLSDALLKLVDIITPNESETEILTGLSLSNEKEIKRAASILLNKVNEAVVITLGSKGTYCVTKSGEAFFTSAYKVEVVDTTAAGDVFNGYLVAALAQNKGLREAIIFANHAASISVTRNGAQSSIPLLEDLTLNNNKK